VAELQLPYEKVLAGEPFHERLADKSQDPLKAEIARTALKVSTSATCSAAAAAYEHALSMLCAKTESSV